MAADLAVASCFLVAHVFVLNDWSGMSSDLRDPNRASNTLARSLTRLEAMWMCIGLLAAGLLLFAALGSRPTVIALGIAAASALYSAPPSHGKGVPLVNSLLHLIGGTLHFLVGYSLFRPVDANGIAVGCFFGLTFMAGHFTHEARDHEGDFASGIRTNAVQFGAKRSFIAGLAAFTIAYAALALLALRGILPRALVLGAALYPLHLYWTLRALHEGLSFENVRRVQRRYRALYGVIGILMTAAMAARIVRWF